MEGGGALGDQEVRVLNTGTDPLVWNASISEQAGNTVWLSVSPDTGPALPVALGENPARITLSANPNGLAAGAYTALVEVRSESQGSPRFITAVLNVRAASATPVLNISPGGLFFVSAAGSNAEAQTFQVSRNRGGEIGFQAAASTFDGEPWLGVTPASGITSLSGGTSLTVELSPEGLPGGVYQGLVSITLGDGIVQSVPVSLLVTPDSDCIPSGAQLATVSPFQNFRAFAGRPATIEVLLTDAVCGTIVGDGSVLAEFSNGDPAMHLRYAGKGRYAETWIPRSAAPQVNVRLTASTGSFVDGTTIVGNVSSTSAPILSRNGTVNGASFAPGEPLAPGGIISSFGFNLAPGNFAAASIPLPNSLGGLTLLAGGRPAPLYFAGAGQLNAQLPFETPPGAVTQLIARVNGLHSVPQEAVVAAARPGVFLMVSSRRMVRATARAIAQNQDLSLNTPDNPAVRGQAVILYLTGLGAVSPSVMTGAAAPAAEPLARAELDPTAMIGNEQAEVLFLGLTPKFVGLGQANILIPASARIGPDIPIVVTINGQPSNPAVIAIADQP